MRTTTLVLLIAFYAVAMSGVAWGQTLYDSFADGEFTSNPAWGGNTSAWTVVANSDAAAGATGSNTLRLAAAAVAQTDYLSSQVSSWGTSQEWGFWIGRRAQSFTASNQMYVWLYATESTLNNTTVDGYRIAIGDDTGNDEIRLEYVVDGTVSSTVITSTGAISNGLTDIGFLVRVTRSSSGAWELFTSTLPTSNGNGAIATDIPNATNAATSQGTGTNNSLVPAANGYLGVGALHSTGSNPISTVEFDQVYLTVSNGAAPPTLTSPTATNITNTTATLGATITSDGGASITDRGTVWKTTTGVTITDNPLSEGGTTTGAFSHSRTSLPAGTQIFYKGYATNSVGTSLSPEGNFYTLSNEPASHVTGFSASAVSGSQINLTWNTVTADGYLILRRTGADPTGLPSDAIAYSVGNTIGDATVAALVTSGGTGSASITGLTSGTEYHFSIIPFGYNGTNAQTYNYKTDGTIPTANATTLENAIIITTLGSAYTEDFNTLATSGTSSTLPPGWFFSESGSNANTTYTADAGSSTAGETYSYGTGTNTERALGSIASTNLQSKYGAKIVNSSGSSISALTIAYTGEEWRLGDAARGTQDQLIFEYSLDATSLTTGTWVAATVLDFKSPKITGTTGALDGNASANRTAVSATISGITIANGSSVWIRWSDVNISGNDDGLAIDDFSVTANTGNLPAGTYSTLWVNGTTTLGGNITVNGNLIVNAGATLNAGSFTVTLKGNWNNAGTLNAGTGKFIMSGTTAQTMSGSTFNDLEIDNPAGVSMLTDETVNGTLTLTNGTFSVGNNTLTLNGPAIAGTPTNLSTTSGSSLSFGGSSSGVSIPSSVTALNNLTINNSNGVLLGAAATINGTLTLTAGKLTLNGNNLTVAAISGGGSSSFVNTDNDNAGFLTLKNIATSVKTFPVGHGSSYNPVTLKQVSDATPHDYSVLVRSGLVSLPLNNSAAALQREWVILQSPWSSGDSPLTDFSLQWNGQSEEGSLFDALFDPSSPPSVSLFDGWWHNPGGWVRRIGSMQSWTTNGGAYPASGTIRSQILFGGSPWTISTADNPLPIQLASFTGTFVNNSVRLNWRTISEINNFGFYVQRRATGTTEWTELQNSFVPGHGTTNEPQNYTYTDHTVTSGSWQYRLRQVDLDGTNHFTDPILVNTLTDVKEVAPIQFALKQNYPNPFNPETNIKFSVAAIERTRLEVFNLLGQKVATLFDQVAEPGYYYTVRFDGSHLASGVYIYHLQSGKQSEVRKLMLVK